MTFKQVQFVASYPPTMNTIWRKSRTGMYLTAQGKAYKEEIAQAARVALSQTDFNSFDDNELLVVVVHLFRPRKIGDIDNLSKLILDGMQKVVYSNDSQIIELHLFRHDDKDNPRVEVDVYNRGVKEEKPKKRAAASLI